MPEKQETFFFVLANELKRVWTKSVPLHTHISAEDKRCKEPRILIVFVKIHFRYLWANELSMLPQGIFDSLRNLEIL